MFLFIRTEFKLAKSTWELNTSHVLIYHNQQSIYGNKGKFKYISCSYLSYPEIFDNKCHPNLNTSHVLIYHVSGLFNIPNNTDLNTSHVLIYPFLI